MVIWMDVSKRWFLLASSKGTMLLSVFVINGPPRWFQPPRSIQWHSKRNNRNLLSLPLSPSPITNSAVPVTPN